MHPYIKKDFFIRRRALLSVLSAMCPFVFAQTASRVLVRSMGALRRLTKHPAP